MYAAGLTLSKSRNGLERFEEIVGSAPITDELLIPAD